MLRKHLNFSCHEEKREVLTLENALHKSIETQETKQNPWKYLDLFPSALEKKTLAV